MRATFRGHELTDHVKVQEGRAQQTELQCKPKYVDVGASVACEIAAHDTYGNVLHGEAAIDGLQIDRMGEAGPLRLAAAGADDAYAYKATFTALAAGRAGVIIMLPNGNGTLISLVNVRKGSGGGGGDDKAADAGAVAASPPPPKSGGWFGR